MDTKAVLLNRVRLGNSKLYEAWSKACRASTEVEYASYMSSIDRAWPRLDTLCQELIATGHNTCLYDSPLCRNSPDSKWFCYVCSAKVLPPVQVKLEFEAKEIFIWPRSTEAQEQVAIEHLRAIQSEVRI